MWIEESLLAISGQCAGEAPGVGTKGAIRIVVKRCT